VLLVSAQRGDTPSEAALKELRQIEPTLDEAGNAMEEHENADYENLLPTIRIAAPGLDVSNIKVDTLITTNGPELQFSRPLFPNNVDRPIDAYYNYLRTAVFASGYEILDPDRDELSKTIASLVEKNRLSAITHVNLGAKADDQPPHARIEGKCIVALSDSTDGKGTLYAYGFDPAEPGVNCSRTWHHLPEDIVQLYTARGLIEKIGDRYQPLPKLSALWDDVAGKDVGRLADVLSRRASEVDPPVRTTGPRFLIGSAAGPIS
jgi:hypothetical protein